MATKIDINSSRREQVPVQLLVELYYAYKLANITQLRRDCDELVALLRERSFPSSPPVHLVSNSDGAGLAPLFDTIAELGEQFTQVRSGC